MGRSSEALAVPVVLSQAESNRFFTEKYHITPSDQAVFFPLTIDLGGVTFWVDEAGSVNIYWLRANKLADSYYSPANLNTIAYWLNQVGKNDVPLSSTDRTQRQIQAACTAVAELFTSDPTEIAALATQIAQQTSQGNPDQVSVLRK